MFIQRRKINLLIQLFQKDCLTVTNTMSTEASCQLDTAHAVNSDIQLSHLNICFSWHCSTGTDAMCLLNLIHGSHEWDWLVLLRQVVLASVQTSGVLMCPTSFWLWSLRQQMRMHMAEHRDSSFMGACGECCIVLCGSEMTLSVHTWVSYFLHLWRFTMYLNGYDR